MVRQKGPLPNLPDMSYDPNYDPGGYDYNYADPNDVNAYAYYNTSYPQQYYPFNCPIPYPPQGYTQQFQPYPAYQWVPQAQEVPGHSYRHNRPRGRGRQTDPYYQNYYYQGQETVLEVTGQPESKDDPNDQSAEGSPAGGPQARSGRGRSYYAGRSSRITPETGDRRPASKPSGVRSDEAQSQMNKDGNALDTDSKSSTGGRRGQGKPSKKKVEDESQRSKLTNELSRGKYECMVCYNNVRCEHAIWNCSNCFHVFHLHCIKKWARTSTVVDNEGSVSGWRCPACQKITEKVPNQYRCYCGKLRDPPYSQYDIPHSCGEVCNRKKRGDCVHPCTLLCHPGPCPPCSSTISKTCDCSKTKQLVRCGNDISFKCENKCSKKLNCRKHECQVVCHSGDCKRCEEKLTQECYGGHTKREIVCGSEESRQSMYSCETECRKILACGNHTCEQPCHPGDCGPCPLLPRLITHCHCGQSKIADLPQGERSSCADPIPSCDKTCSKPLECGPQDAPHVCQRRCHTGDCGPCEGETTLKCHCGAKEKAFSCSEVGQFTEENPYKCEKRCGKKKMCGRHKCQETCCTREIHICEVTCGKKLTCGRHKCKALCHRGNCQPCLNAGYDELTCHCGAEVILPPIPCGTRPPECRQPCSRTHPCDHEVHHNCHSDNVCPPCTFLTEKLCMGGHEFRKNIPCHMMDISCGRPCGRMLSCGVHKCIKSCHKGECEKEGEKCTQPCTRKRESCEHPCAAPCHPDDACPKVPCKAPILIKCPCGHRSAKSSCNKGADDSFNIAEFQKLTVQQLSSGRGMDVAKIAGATKTGTRMLECDAECAKIERNRRIALALEIKNPDLQGKLGSPPYTDFIKDFARKYPRFVGEVEKALQDLVQTAKQSKHPSRSHAFQPMSRDQRQFIHELAEFYNCETQSYDSEPKKNVVATAKRDKCWMPSVSVMTLIAREMGPKGPPPVIHFKPHESRPTPLGQKFRPESPESASGLSSITAPSSSTSSSRPDKPGPSIDYFDFSVR